MKAPSLSQLERRICDLEKSLREAAGHFKSSADPQARKFAEQLNAKLKPRDTAGAYQTDNLV